MTSVITRPSLRSQRDLALAQVKGIEAWVRLGSPDHGRGSATSREGRMDLTRRREVLETERRALLARLDDQPAAGLSGPAAVRALVVHHEPWSRGHLAELLEGHGLVVVAALENGAEAVGAAAAEQPDLLVLSDPIAMLTATEVVERCKAVAPRTFVAVQARSGDHADALLAAGADAVLSRQVAPVDLVARVTRAVLAG